MFWKIRCVSLVMMVASAGCGDPAGTSDGTGGTDGASVVNYSCVHTDLDGDVSCRGCVMDAICNPPNCSFASSTCQERGYTKLCSHETNADRDWLVKPGMLCESPFECTVASQCQSGCCVQSDVTGLGQCSQLSDCTGSGGGGGACPYNDCTESPYTGMRYMCIDGRCVCKPHCQPIGSSVCCGGSLCAGDCVGNPCCI